LKLKKDVIASVKSKQKSEKVDWQYFNEHKYIQSVLVKDGEDAYKANKFNQKASDNIKSNRGVPDTRHHR